MQNPIENDGKLIFLIELEVMKKLEEFEIREVNEFEKQTVEGNEREKVFEIVVQKEMLWVLKLKD